MYKQFNQKFVKKDPRQMMHLVNQLENKIHATCSCPTKRYSNGNNVKTCVCGEGYFNDLKHKIKYKFTNSPVGQYLGAMKTNEDPNDTRVDPDYVKNYDDMPEHYKQSHPQLGTRLTDAEYEEAENKRIKKIQSSYTPEYLQKNKGDYENNNENIAEASNLKNRINQ